MTGTSPSSVLRPKSCHTYIFRCINNVCLAWWLIGVILVTALRGVTLVHHLRHRGPTVSGRDSYHFPAPGTTIVPSCGQRHHSLWQRVVVPVAFGGVSSVPAGAEVVDGENGRRSRGLNAGEWAPFDWQDAALVT